MKSLTVFLLFLMNSLLLLDVTNAANADDPPLLTIKGIKPIREISIKSYIDDEASRVARIALEADTYLMRFDPPEHCGRIVLCAEKENEDKECSSEPAAKSLMLTLGDRKIYEGANVKGTMTEDKIEIFLKANKYSLKFNPRSEKDVQIIIDDFIEMAPKKLRIETSSFYCRIHIGVTGIMKSEVPLMHIPKYSEDATTTTDKNTNGLPKPFPLGFHEKEIKKKPFFGPLLSMLNVDGEIKKIQDGFTVDKEAQCSFPHDMMGFAKWSMPLNKDNATLYKDNILTHNVFRYNLADKCSKTTGDRFEKCGESLDKPYQIDIEIGQTFDPNLKQKYHRCFGFALIFGESEDKIDFDASKAFEFYIAASIFIAPDSLKVRALRIPRDGLKKIRISFFKKTKTITKPFAIVEYDFLNDDIAGVREFVQLPDTFAFDKLKYLSLLSEGYCEVRVLDVKREDMVDCWKLTGCDVFTRK